MSAAIFDFNGAGAQPDTRQKSAPAVSASRALEDFRAQANPDADAAGMEERYPGSQQRNFDRQPGVSEMDALIAYLQVLGTMVDFSTFQPDPNR